MTNSIQKEEDILLKRENFLKDITEVYKTLKHIPSGTQGWLTNYPYNTHQQLNQLYKSLKPKLETYIKKESAKSVSLPYLKSIRDACNAFSKSIDGNPELKKFKKDLKKLSDSFFKAVKAKFKITTIGEVLDDKKIKKELGEFVQYIETIRLNLDTMERQIEKISTEARTTFLATLKKSKNKFSTNIKDVSENFSGFDKALEALYNLCDEVVKGTKLYFQETVDTESLQSDMLAQPIIGGFEHIKDNLQKPDAPQQASLPQELKNLNELLNDILIRTFQNDQIRSVFKDIIEEIDIFIDKLEPEKLKTLLENAVNDLIEKEDYTPEAAQKLFEMFENRQKWIMYTLIDEKEFRKNLSKKLIITYGLKFRTHSQTKENVSLFESTIQKLGAFIKDLSSNSAL